MSNNPCINVPSPKKIHDMLFSNPSPQPPVFPGTWSATALLTPFGGLNARPPLNPSDQLVVARVYCDSTQRSSRFLRMRLYLLESLLYYDFFFSTTGSQTVWYWLVSDPADPNPNPRSSAYFGPYSTPTQVPSATFLRDASFPYIGTWNVVGQRCDGYSAAASKRPAGTWFSFLSQTRKLSRIMNVDNTNDFKIPVLGAYYLVNFPTFEQDPSLELAAVDRAAKDNARAAGASSPMVTLQDIQTAMINPPAGASQVRCTPADIAAVIPGISFPRSQPTPPAWTNQVQSFCYMMGQDTYPYFCEVFYDYTVNKAQVSVFVTQDSANQYNARMDELLPLGTVGPSLGYEWNDRDSQWQATCSTPQGGIVPMPVPNFVQSGGGRCRAVIRENPYFGQGQVTIWSVMLGSGQSNWADFWYWFNSQQQGVVFSLAPASSLTMIDYQTFIQNPSFPSCTFDEPTSGLPICESAVAERRQKMMLIPKGGFKAV